MPVPSSEGTCDSMSALMGARCAARRPVRVKKGPEGGRSCTAVVKEEGTPGRSGMMMKRKMRRLSALGVGERAWKTLVRVRQYGRRRLGGLRVSSGSGYELKFAR